MKRNTKPEHFFTPEEKTVIEAAVETAERATSAEIKLIVLRHCWQDIQAKAAELFRKHRLYETQDRNAVLILLVTTNREFLIHGDEGIHTKVDASFWDDVKDLMQRHFRSNDFGTGLKLGIEKIGEKLAAFYPCRADDVNEIDNGIAYEDK